MTSQKLNLLIIKGPPAARAACGLDIARFERPSWIPEAPRISHIIEQATGHQRLAALTRARARLEMLKSLPGLPAPLPSLDALVAAEIESHVDWQGTPPLINFQRILPVPERALIAGFATGSHWCALHWGSLWPFGGDPVEVTDFRMSTTYAFATMINVPCEFPAAITGRFPDLSVSLLYAGSPDLAGAVVAKSNKHEQRVDCSITEILASVAVGDNEPIRAVTAAPSVFFEALLARVASQLKWDPAI